jgi:MerR family transcriptional regulator, light-induced transcriptional regulator
MASMAADQGYLRIGELSRRTGVAPELLRAWERRYGLLRPARSDGGFRLYSDADERRVELMRSHLRRGLAAAEAARLALDSAALPRPSVADETVAPELSAGARRLREALDAYGELEAHSALDALLGGFTLESVLSDVVIPYLAELGERWSAGEVTVAQEHFASNFLRGRLLGLAREWDAGEGPRAVLACAPGELHDLALIVFGIALRRQGWRITYLGPDTPVDTLADAARTLEPELVVVVASSARRLRPLEETLTKLVRHVRVAIAGAGATRALAERTGAEHLDTDPVSAAASVAAGR